MYLLYSRHGRPTGQVLGECLGIPHGTNVPERQDVLVRWGNSEATQYRPTNGVINGRNGIAAAADKFDSLQAMRTAGVPVPNFSHNNLELRPPYLARSRQHTRGLDITLCMQALDAARCGTADYYIEYIPTAREYRIHAFEDRIIHVTQKVLTNEEAYTPWIRNHGHGYTFRSPRIRLTPLQEYAAISAVKALRLTFGAVDLIVADDGQTYVLEVNTAPACSPRTGRAYVDAIASKVLLLTGNELEVNYEPLQSLTYQEHEEDIEEDPDRAPERTELIGFDSLNQFYPHLNVPTFERI